MCLFQNILSKMWKTVQMQSDHGLHYLHMPFFAQELMYEILEQLLDGLCHAKMRLLTYVV